MRRTNYFLISALIYFLIPASFLLTAKAESETSETIEPPPAFSWSSVGPYGGDVRSLAISPSDAKKLYLGTSDGQIYRSTDAAASWQRLLSFNHPGFCVEKIVIDQEQPNTLYAPVWFIANDTEGTIYKSTDGGDTWKELEAIHGHSVRNLAIAPSNHNILVAVAIEGGYQSNDAGQTWNRITPENHPDLKRLHSVAIDPKNPKIIYIGTEHLPWKTEDGGENWFLIKGHPNDAKQQFIDDSDIFSIVINPQDPSRVLASACSGIYQTSNSAETWTKFQGIPFTSRRTHIIYPDPTNADVIYSGTTEGLWKTTDSGKTWRLMTSLRTVVNAIAIHPSDPQKIYLGIKYGGVLVGTSGGEQFRVANDGFVNRQISTIVTDRKDPSRVYAGVLFNGTEGGLYISQDSGKSWKPASRGLESQDVYSLFQSLQNERLLFAGTNLGLYRSTDRGETWQAVSASKPAPFIAPSQTSTPTAPTKLTVKPVVKKAPAKTGAVRLGKISDRVTEVVPLYKQPNLQSGVLIASWDGLFKLDDKTARLEQIKIGNYVGKVLSLATHPDHPNLIYAGTTNGLYLSQDGGKTWELLSISEEERHPVVQAIGIAPQNEQLMLIGTQKSCYYSRDGGRSWQRRGKGIPYGEAVVIRFNPTNPNIVAVGDYKVGGIYISTNAGETFQRVDRDLLPSSRIRSLTFDSVNPYRLYVGSFSGGVYLFEAENRRARQ
ncbi:MAG: hypothetical protein JNN15_15600 [Blastocatellia bacterium]|nr:hypothetical protein [Blastocatellia bacterium]